MPPSTNHCPCCKQKLPVVPPAGSIPEVSYEAFWVEQGSDEEDILAWLDQFPECPPINPEAVAFKCDPKDRRRWFDCRVGYMREGEHYIVAKILEYAPVKSQTFPRRVHLNVMTTAEFSAKFE